MSEEPPTKRSKKVGEEERNEVPKAAAPIASPSAPTADRLVDLLFGGEDVLQAPPEEPRDERPPEPSASSQQQQQADKDRELPSTDIGKKPRKTGRASGGTTAAKEKEREKELAALKQQAARLIREAPVALPKFKPKQLSLDDVLKKKGRGSGALRRSAPEESSAGAASSAPAPVVPVPVRVEGEEEWKVRQRMEREREEKEMEALAARYTGGRQEGEEEDQAQKKKNGTWETKFKEQEELDSKGTAKGASQQTGTMTEELPGSGTGTTELDPFNGEDVEQERAFRERCIRRRRLKQRAEEAATPGGTGSGGSASWIEDASTQELLRKIVKTNVATPPPPGTAAAAAAIASGDSQPPAVVTQLEAIREDSQDGTSVSAFINHLRRSGSAKLIPDPSPRIGSAIFRSMTSPPVASPPSIGSPSLVRSAGAASTGTTSTKTSFFKILTQSQHQ